MSLPAAQAVPDNANDGCVGVNSEQAGKASACSGCPNQNICASGEARKVDPAIGEIKQKLASVKHKILVLSGKGGVGKSSVACQLAWTLASMGRQVGLLDVDICGPSVPRMLGLVGHEVHQSAAGWSPVYVDDNLAVMSIGFMLPNADEAVIWRGPRKNGLIKQFLCDVTWEDLDFLIIDTPPGTSDEHISIIQYMKEAGVDGAVIVTTPQEVAMMDVRKEINFCKKTKVPIIGVIENMSGLEIKVEDLTFTNEQGSDTTEEILNVLMTHAPHLLQHRFHTEVFPAFGSGPEGMAQQFGVPYLGRLPLDPMLLKACENGEALVDAYPNAVSAAPFRKIVESIEKGVSTL